MKDDKVVVFYKKILGEIRNVIREERSGIQRYLKWASSDSVDFDYIYILLKYLNLILKKKFLKMDEADF